MPSQVSLNAKGPDVRLCQSALNGHVPSKLPRLVEDGLFGMNTQARVKEFQTSVRLRADGVVGAMTWSKLLLVPTAMKSSEAKGCQCGNSPASAALMGSMLQNYQSLATALGITTPFDEAAKYSTVTTSPLPNNARAVNLGEKGVLIPVFGSSIDFSTVLVTTLTGMGGRAFVATVPSPFFGLPAIQIVNAGHSPTDETLLHEFTHVWQSQHAASPLAYMVSAVFVQTVADQANATAGKTVCSAYAYVPGKPFGEYNVEQIAQQVGKGESAIRTHCKSAVKNAKDSENIKSHNVKTVQIWSATGVKI